jgi:hypothetical protein
VAAGAGADVGAGAGAGAHAAATMATARTIKAIKANFFIFSSCENCALFTENIMVNYGFGW